MNQKRFFAIVATLLAFTWSMQGFAISTEALKQGIPSLAPMLERVTPAVVSIRVTKTMEQAPGNPYGQQLPEELRRYFENIPGYSGQRGEPQDQPYAMGEGSGIIIDAENGYLLTNHHVVDGASEIVVQLIDGRHFDAKLLGSDASTDVALIQIDAPNLTEIALADVDTVKVGDYVVAIGNPFGIGQTVTSGIVSALGRAGLNNDNYEDFIQTDAAINVGNSGGALVDMEGRLIGMNTAIISDSGGSNGIGFAVPGDMLAAVSELLKRDGEVRRGMLGVTIADVTPDVIAALDVGVDAGAIVTSIVPGSAAEQAGIHISDVIVAVDNEKIAGSRELRNTVGLKTQGQEVKLALYRQGHRMDLDARIGGPQGSAEIAGASSGDSRPAESAADFRGARLQNMAPGNSNGVAVVEVAPRSPAYAAGLRQGDVITEVNRQAIATTSDFDDALASAGRFTALNITRDNQNLLLFVP